MSILKDLGYKIDLSICPAFDHSYDGGPDFSDFDARPSLLGGASGILQIPVTSAFVGLAGKHSKFMYNFSGNLDWLKLRAILSRLNIVDRLMLSPEGYSHAEHRKLTHFLLGEGVRGFHLELSQSNGRAGYDHLTQRATTN